MAQGDQSAARNLILDGKVEVEGAAEGEEEPEIDEPLVFTKLR